MSASPTLYSPVDGNGFSQHRAQRLQQQQQQQQQQVVDDPEDFYRPGQQPQLNTSEVPPPDFSHSSPVSPNSPADSQAPIMASTREQQLQFAVVGMAQEYPPPPLPSNSGPTLPTSTVPPPTVQEHPEYAEHPTQEHEYAEYPTQEAIYPPVGDFRTSVGVVNGEVGAVPGPTPRTPRAPHPDGGYAMPMTPLTPAMKTPTYGAEATVSLYDEKVRKLDKSDLAVKLKVRLAKIFLRSINCVCSLVVVALVASTFAIFYATRHLPPRNNLPPWAANTPQWPQLTVLVIACVSLALSLYIMYAYWRSGHNRAERIAIYWTIFAVAAFIFTITMWAVAAGIMVKSRENSNGKDLWGWSCKDNNRRKLFQDDINYRLVCRQQDWVLVCAIIEISIEVLSLAVYAYAFYRIASKRRLRKSMDVRDTARSEVWRAKLREQQASEAADATNDPETNANTEYNRLASSAVPGELEEGRAVPMLMKPPPGHYATAPHKAGNATESPDVAITPPPTAGGARTPSPPAGAMTSGPIPPTPRSVSFLPPPMSPTAGGMGTRTPSPPAGAMASGPIPPTPRSVSFLPPPTSPAAGDTGTRTPSPPAGAMASGPIPPTPRSVSFLPPPPPSSRGSR